MLLLILSYLTIGLLFQCGISYVNRETYGAIDKQPPFYYNITWPILLYQLLCNYLANKATLVNRKFKTGDKVIYETRDYKTQGVNKVSCIVVEVIDDGSYMVRTNQGALNSIMSSNLKLDVISSNKDKLNAIIDD